MWDPKSYDRFDAERQQPSVDLARRLEGRNFRRILDVGCGSGLSTEPLCRLWPDAEVIGLDRNPAMLAEARKRLPIVTFIERDCSKPLNDLGTFDLVFSNAFIQWIPNPEGFITDVMSMLSDDGVFALQMPLFQEMPAHKAITETLSEFSIDENQPRRLHFRKSWRDYYEMLVRTSASVTLWITEYIHRMESVEAIFDFVSSTALNPYLDLMDSQTQLAFKAALLTRLSSAYPASLNGEVLFPFRRFFCIAESDSNQ